MAQFEEADFAARWASFVESTRERIDTVWKSSSSWPAWAKSDGSKVTALDLLLDVNIRSCLAEHFPELEVLSEETGRLQPLEGKPAGLAIVDPIDGTESLINGRASWWVSIGLTDASSRPLAGLIYQPATYRLHDSQRPDVQKLASLVVGMSPDRLTDNSTADVRTRMIDAGATLVDTPHAVEKIAAVLEGRATATVYLPSKKSPTWHSWDLAAGVALAQANHLLLATLDGKAIHVDEDETTFNSPWICAVDDEVWRTVREAL